MPISQFADHSRTHSANRGPSRRYISISSANLPQCCFLVTFGLMYASGTEYTRKVKAGRVLFNFAKFEYAWIFRPRRSVSLLFLFSFIPTPTAPPQHFCTLSHISAAFDSLFSMAQVAPPGMIATLQVPLSPVLLPPPSKYTEHRVSSTAFTPDSVRASAV